MSVKPSAQSGKFSHRFDTVVGRLPDDCPLYQLPLARRIRHSTTRVWDPSPVRLPLEALQEQVDRSLQELETELRRALADHDMPPCFTEHPTVKAAAPGQLIHPASMYIDGVGFSRLDSCLGVWIHFSLSKEKHLLTVL